MIVRREHRILVQGITGRQGSWWTERMIAYGATVTGGVNPRKAGTEHLDRPVFASARPQFVTSSVARCACSAGASG